MAKRSTPYDIDSLTDAALRVFRERGYDGASMADLAAAAGISKAAFYHHVRGKEELLQRGFDRSLGALFGVLDEDGATGGPALDRVAYVVRRVLELENDLLPEVSVLLRTRGNSPVERTAMDKRRQFDRAFAALIEAAQTEGSLRTDLSSQLLSRLVIGMCTSVVEWWDPDGALDINDLAAAVLAMTFDGLASQTQTLQDQTAQDQTAQDQTTQNLTEPTRSARRGASYKRIERKHIH